MQNQNTQIRRAAPAPRSGGAEYSDTMGCRQCLAKHLSKAAVEAAEYFEESGRESEFVLCLGDIACAEDHASSLDRYDVKRKLRSARDMLWAGDQGVVVFLRSMAGEAVSDFFASSQKKPDVGDGSNG